MKTETQAIVIGGGVLGCSVLYHLTKMGWSDVMLLERAELTAGSTWHAAANIHAMHGHAGIARLHAYTLKLYDKLEAETGQSVGLHRCGGIYLATSQDRFDELKVQRARARYLGIDFEMVGVDEIKTINPLVKTDRVLGGMYGPEDGHVDPSGVTHAFAKGARMGGAVIERHCPVEAMSQRADGTWDVSTPKGSIHAQVVVNVAGLWAREVAAMAGYTLPLVPMEHQYVVTDTIPEVAALAKEIPLTRDQDGEFYMRQEGQGLLLGAYERHGRHWSVDGTPMDFAQELLPDDIERMAPNMEAAIDLVPCFGTAGIKRVVNGPMMYSPDSTVLIGPMPDVRNHYVACGMIPGFSQSAGVGWALAEWIVEGEPPLDLFAMDVARYGDWATKSYTLVKSAENYGMRFAIAFPAEERPAGRPLRTSPVYDRLKAEGAVFGSAYGFERPLWYAKPGVEGRDILSFRRPNWFAPVGEECRALRASVGMLEISTFAKYEVAGPGAEAFLDRILACRVPQKTGRMVLAPMLNTKGGIIGDFTLTRLGPQTFYLVGAGTAERFHKRWFDAHRPPSGVTIRSETTSRAGLAIAGPKSRDLLAAVSREDVSGAAFPFMTARDMDVGMAPCRVMRVSFTGDLGYELHMPAEYQMHVYDTLRKAGADFGLTMAGGRALDSLRLEKSYGRWGLEFTADTTPFEAGLDRFVKLDKGDFVGRDGLVARHNQGLRWKLVTMTVDADGADCWSNEPILLNGEVAGVVSSGGFGHVVDKSIALAYLNPDVDVTADGFAIEILGDMRPAKVETEALFDPKNERLRG